MPGRARPSEGCDNGAVSTPLTGVVSTDASRPASAFAGLDTAAMARALSGVADRDEDLADVFCERVVTLSLASDDEVLGARLWREEGLAVRLRRDGRTFLASRDALSPRVLVEALRQVARVQPRAVAEPSFAVAPFAGSPDPVALQAFARALVTEIRRQHAAFPLRLEVRAHRRDVQVVTPRLVPAAESESFASIVCDTPWARHGQLLATLDEPAARELATTLVALFRSRQAPPARLERGVLVLGSAAAAVLLHEAVGHTLEADTLAATGRPEAAIGVALGPPLLDVLDDPGAAPAGCRRQTDDEGVTIQRRWLLRRGVVEEPLADAAWASRVPALLPGAGRRGSRHLPPAPRMTHLELLAGGTSEDDLLRDADGGIFAPEASRGALDPVAGIFTLDLPFAWRIRRGECAEILGPGRLVAAVPELLAAVVAKGGVARTAGAGWCAKGGQKLAVWATSPWLRLEGVTLRGGRLQ